MALTKKDKEDITQIVSRTISENNSHIDYVIDRRFGNFEEKITEKLVSFRSDIMNHISSFAKEISDNREERTVQGEHIRRNTKRIGKLEAKVSSLSQ